VYLKKIFRGLPPEESEGRGRGGKGGEGGTKGRRRREEGKGGRRGRGYGWAGKGLDPPNV
jgi:hypothetical protein